MYINSIYLKIVINIFFFFNLKKYMTHLETINKCSIQFFIEIS